MANCNGSLFDATGCTYCDKCKTELANALRNLRPLVDVEVKEEPTHWPGRYKPEAGGAYWQIDYLGNINPLLNNIQSTTDIARAMGVCCKTKEEAEFVIRQKVAELELIDKLEELNEGWRPDWADATQKKWYVYLDRKGNRIIFDDTWTHQSLPDCFHGKSREVWERAAEELGEEKIKLALWGN